MQMDEYEYFDEPIMGWYEECEYFILLFNEVVDECTDEELEWYLCYSRIFMN